ncbi:MAG: ABC transporter permease [Rhabdochlamydiaceae bacterium]|nr:ABC transporter permease [Candidatus Amphrikana amoebophyrae]
MIWLIQILGLFQREVKRFMSLPIQTLGSPIINSSLYLIIFGIGLGGFIKAPIGDSYLEFLIPGMIMMNVIRGTYDNTSGSIVSSKYVNELQDLRVAPLSKPQIIIATVAASVCRGVIITILTYFVGLFFSYVYLGKPLLIAHPLFTIAFILLGGACFSTLALSVSIFARTFEQITVFGSFILAPLIYLGGVFFTLEMLSPFWQKVAQFNPLYYLIEGMRHAMLNQNELHLWKELSILIAFYLLISILAFFSLRKGKRYVK